MSYQAKNHQADEVMSIASERQQQRGTAIGHSNALDTHEILAGPIRSVAQKSALSRNVQMSSDNKRSGVPKQLPSQERHTQSHAQAPVSLHVSDITSYPDSTERFPLQADEPRMDTFRKISPHDFNSISGAALTQSSTNDTSFNEIVAARLKALQTLEKNGLDQRSAIFIAGQASESVKEEKQLPLHVRLAAKLKTLSQQTSNPSATLQHHTKPTVSPQNFDDEQNMDFESHADTDANAEQIAPNKNDRVVKGLHPDEDKNTELVTAPLKNRHSIPGSPTYSIGRIKGDQSDKNGSKTYYEDAVAELKPPALFNPPKYLSDEGISVIRNYVQERLVKCMDILDDDIVASRMVRADKIAKERVLVSCFDPEADSEEEEGRVALTGDYQEELDFSLRHEFWKQITHDTNASTVVDKNTLRALKRKFGLYRRSEVLDGLPKRKRTGSCAGSQADDAPSDSDKSGGGPRRLTRGMARTTRVKKRESRLQSRVGRGLMALIEAAEECDPASTPFDPGTGKRICNIDDDVSGGASGGDKKASKGSRKRLRESPTDLDMIPESVLDLTAYVRVSKWKSKDAITNMGLDKKLEIKVASIMIGGKNVEPKYRKRYENNEESQAIRSLTRQKPKRPKYNYQSLKGSMLQGKPNKRMKNPCDSDIPGNASASPIEYKREEFKIPWIGAAKVSGVSGSPDLTPRLLLKAIDLHKNTLPHSPDFPRRERFQEATSSKFADLNGLMRSFARYKFFYSDMDQPWFNYNEYEAEFENQGIILDAKFTRSEWRRARKSIRNRPRRFSQKFISEEMEKLKAYRETARAMQHRRLPRPEGFDFAIPAPIEAGGIVSAMHQEWDIIDRGVVLDYDEQKQSYLVLFDRKTLGYCYIPDTEVAIDGALKLLHIEGTAIDKGEATGTREQNRTHVEEVQAKHARKAEVTTSGKCNGKPEFSDKNGHVKEKPQGFEVIFEKCKQRHASLTDAIANLESNVASDRLNIGSQMIADERFAWLVANLEATALSLESLPKELVKSKAKAQEPKMGHEIATQSTKEPPQDEWQVYSMWVRELLHQASQLRDVLPTVNASDTEEPTFSRIQRFDFLEKRLDSARKLLVCTEFAASCERPIRSMLDALGIALKECSNDLESTTDVGIHTEREKALTELQAAICDFQKVLKAQHGSVN